MLAGNVSTCPSLLLQLWIDTENNLPKQNVFYCNDQVPAYSYQDQKAAINTLKMHGYNLGSVRREALPEATAWYSTTALCNPKARRQVWGRSRIRSVALCHPEATPAGHMERGARCPCELPWPCLCPVRSQGVRPQHRHVKHIVGRRWSGWVYFNLEMWPLLPFMMCQSKLPLAAVRILVLADSCKEQQTGRSQQQMW